MDARVWLVLIFVMLAACSPATRDPLPNFPRLVLWAWERPEFLDFIVPKATGVAFLASTVTLAGEGLSYRPRMQPLRVPPQTALIAVVRIESRGPHDVAPRLVAEQVLRAVPASRVVALQIDYDAHASERAFYRDLLFELRRQLPSTIPLEMTALVSWCMSDDWLRDLPVADAVPMFFSMGADRHAASERMREPLCKSSIGISTGEFYTGIPRERRIFVFHSRAWNETDYRAVLLESAKW